MFNLLPKATALFQDNDRVRTMMGEWEESQSKLAHDVLIGDWVGDAESVADLGCGVGRLVSHLQAKDYVGFDNSVAMLVIARETYPDFTFIERNIFEGSSRSFDVAVIYAVVQHCGSPLDAVRILMEKWDAQRYIFSFLVGDLWEDLYLSTVVNFGKLLVFLDSVRLHRVHVEKHGPERFGWVIMEVSRESSLSAGAV